MSPTRFRGTRARACARGGGALVLALALVACGDERHPLAPGTPQADVGRGNGPPFTVSIRGRQDTMLVGQSVHLRAILVNPGQDSVPGRADIVWSSGDTTIIKVDSTGLVQAVGAGTAIVTAKFVSWDRAATTSVSSLAATLRNAAMLKGMWVGARVLSAPTEFPGNVPLVSTMNREFNGIIAVSAFVWGAMQYLGPGWWNFAPGEEMVQNARTHGQIVHGGPLVWHLGNPPWVDTLRASDVSRDSAIYLMTRQIDSVVGHFRGSVRQWEVANQVLADGDCGRRPASMSVWERLIGPDWVDIAFREAARMDPDALLYYGDYSMEFPGVRQDSALSLVAGLLAKGIRVDGVMFHGDYASDWVVPPGVLEASMARFGALGLRVDLGLAVRLPVPTSATEAQLAQQAAGYRGFVQACDVSPYCDAVWFGAVDDGHIFWPPASGVALFDANLQKKPAWDSVYNYLARR